MEDKIKNITAVVAAITALLAAILALIKIIITIIKDGWTPILLPLTKFLVFSGTLVIPNGVIIWFFFDLAGKNSNRLEEDVVILALVAQVTIAVSIYAFFWGIWVYPRLRFLLNKKQPAIDNKATENKFDAQLSEEENLDSENGESDKS